MKADCFPQFLNRVWRVAIDSPVTRFVGATRSGNQMTRVIKLSHHPIQRRHGDAGTWRCGEGEPGRRGDLDIVRTVLLTASRFVFFVRHQQGSFNTPSNR
jgi:hypothetical protein